MPLPRITDAPGLQVFPRADGSVRLLWRCPRAGLATGYEPKSVNIPLDIRDPADHDGIRVACQREQRAYALWAAAPARAVPAVVTTLADLSRLYQTHEASPFLSVRENSRRNYLAELRLVEAYIGARVIASIKAEDIKRWHKEARASVEGGGARKAQGLIKRVRALMSFGVIAEVPGCGRVKAILDEMRFEQPARRTVAMTYEQAVALIAKANALGLHSVALAQAIQFETGLRQIDVIGQWTTGEDGKKRWSGLVWQDISADLILTLDTSKTGATVGHDLKAMPLVMAELARVPKDRRIGPVIVHEATGRPYVHMKFSQVWRRVAAKAGLPADVCNRDSRAGAITEGDAAGAAVTELQRMAGHTTAKMTGRYIRSGAVATSAKVAQLRAATRPKEQK